MQSFYLPDNEDDDDHISIKCLPSELIEDAADDFVEEPQPQNNYDQIEEIFNQTINFQIKQWEQQPINVKETQTINTFKSKFDASVKALWDNTNLTDEMGSLSLFNFQAVPEPVPVVTEPLANKYYCLKIIDYDCNNNQGGSNEKFIKSGTNLQLSIWSENEDSEPQSLTNPNEVRKNRFIKKGRTELHNYLF